jgi:putative nucleotidyltransferase with HDIG domain
MPLDRLFREELQRLDRRALGRLGVAALCGLIGALAGAELARRGAEEIDLVAPLAVVAGVLLGRLGIVGFGAGQMLGLALAGFSWRPSFATVLAYAASGLAAHLVFKMTPGVGRGFPNLRSYLAFFAALVVGATATALSTGVTPGSPHWHEALSLVWSRHLASVLLGAPLILLAADRFLPALGSPIDGEVQARRARLLRIGGAGEPTLEDTLAAMRAGPRLGRGMAVGGGLLALTTAIAVPLTGVAPQAAVWLTLLYIVPVFWASLNYGLRGGMLASSGAGLAFLAGSLSLATDPTSGLPVTVLYAKLLMLSRVGGLLGAGQEREAVLRDRLAESNQLLRKDLLRVVQALTGAIEAKDGYTESHLRRVSRYAQDVGDRLGLGAGELEKLRYASLLHDVGKIGVPDQVLGKPGPLAETEVEVMRRHPEIGARILRSIDVLRDVAPVILHHQERFDGVQEGEFPGYPAGLRGEEIPLGARIIAVVDAFDAMTTDRPYRRALEVDEAIGVLREESGKQFDPLVVETFLGVLAARPWRRGGGDDSLSGSMSTDRVH